MGCVVLRKHNGFLSECGKIRETRKMCHVMSIDKYVTCMGWFNVLMTEFIVACLPNPHPLALSRVEPRVTKFDKVPMF